MAFMTWINRPFGTWSHNEPPRTIQFRSFMADIQCVISMKLNINILKPSIVWWKSHCKCSTCAQSSISFIWILCQIGSSLFRLCFVICNSFYFHSLPICFCFAVVFKVRIELCDVFTVISCVLSVILLFSLFFFTAAGGGAAVY